MKIISSNLKRTMSWAETKAAVQKLLHGNPDAIGFQEFYGKDLRRLKGLLNSMGYGVSLETDVPVAYNKDKFDVVAQNSRQFTPRTDWNPPRFGNWIALKDKETGRMSVVTNTHLTQGIKNPRNHKFHREQVQELAQLQRDLKKRFGDAADFYITGDMNTGKLKELAPLLKGTGLKGMHMQGQPIDWIFSEYGSERERLFRTGSDHNSYQAVFKPKGSGEHHSIDTDLTDGKGADGKKGDKDGKGGKKGGKGNKEDGAFTILKKFFNSLGIQFDDEIEKVIRGAMKDGYGPDQIDLIMPDLEKTKAFNKRFAGYAQRIKNGFNAISIGEYLQLENQYHQIMKEAGLPAKFYDTPEDYANFISNNVSINEISSRVKMGMDAAKRVDPSMRRLMAQFYGLGLGDVAAYFLDSKRALPIIERQYSAAGVATWAQRAGFDVNGMGRYEALVERGVTEQQAAQGYGAAKTFADSLGSAARRYGESYSQSDAESDVFFNDNEKRRRILAKEQAAFSGSSAGQTGTSRRQSY